MEKAEIVSRKLGGVKFNPEDVELMAKAVFTVYT
jgi:hypothetical protein